MDDDLGVPAALAAVHDAVRAGNKLIKDGDSTQLRDNLAMVRAMLGVLGLDPLSPPWAARSGAEQRLRPVTDAVIQVLLDERQRARERRDFATADGIRDRLRSVGVGVEDSPDGSRWSIEG